MLGLRSGRRGGREEGRESSSDKRSERGVETEKRGGRELEFKRRCWIKRRSRKCETVGGREVERSDPDSASWTH